MTSWEDEVFGGGIRPPPTKMNNDHPGTLAPSLVEETLEYTKESGMPCFIVDAFANPNSVVGTGNPAAVFLCNGKFNDEPETCRWMQKMAAEFNLPVAAFLWHRDKESGCEGRESNYTVRYFTPTTELLLCGHATLASAAAIFHKPLTACHDLDARLEEVVFCARQDVVSAKINKETESTTGEQTLEKISLKLPAKTVTEIENGSADEREAESMLRKGLGVDPKSIAFIGFCPGNGDLFVELTPEGFSGIGYEHMNFEALMAELNGYTRVLIVCSVAPVASGVDFFSRVFGPKIGINEDYVCGSAHCALAPYFARKLRKNRVVDNQQSKRGGIVECKYDRTDETVEIIGRAMIAMTGHLLCRRNVNDKYL